MMKKRKIQKYIIKLMVLFGILFGNLNLYNESYAVEKIKESIVEVSGTGDWMLVDTYDNKNSSFESFLNQKDSYDILEKTYQMLKKEYGNKYFDVGKQNIEFIGDFRGDRGFVDGDEDSVNQHVNGQIITPLKSLQVSQNYVEQYNLDRKVEIGNCFQASDYQKNAEQVIPVIAGADYRRYYKIGDKFLGKYLGDVEMKFVIKGFFQKKSSIDLADEKMLLDTLIVFPSIQVSFKNKTEFQKTLLSVKCQGYLHYKNGNEFEKHILKLKKIKEKTGFQYVIPITNKDLEKYKVIDIRIAMATFIVALGVWFFESQKVISLIFDCGENLKKNIINSVGVICSIYLMWIIMLYVLMNNDYKIYHLLVRVMFYSGIVYVLSMGIEICKRKDKMIC